MFVTISVHYDCGCAHFANASVFLLLLVRNYEDADSEWLQWAEARFQEIAGQDLDIDRKSFKKALQVRNVRIIIILPNQNVVFVNLPSCASMYPERENYCF